DHYVVTKAGEDAPRAIAIGVDQANRQVGAEGTAHSRTWHFIDDKSLDDYISSPFHIDPVGSLAVAANDSDCLSFRLETHQRLSSAAATQVKAFVLAVANVNRITGTDLICGVLECRPGTRAAAPAGRVPAPGRDPVVGGPNGGKATPCKSQRQHALPGHMGPCRHRPGMSDQPVDHRRVSQSSGA